MTATAKPGDVVTSYPQEPASGVLPAGTRVGLSVYLRVAPEPDANLLAAFGDILELELSSTTRPRAVRVSGDGPWYIEATAGGPLAATWPSADMLREDILRRCETYGANEGFDVYPDGQTRAQSVGIGLLDKPRTVVVAADPVMPSFAEQVAQELPGAARDGFGAVFSAVGEAAGGAARGIVGGTAEGIARGLGVVGILVVLAVVALGVVLLIVAFKAGWL